MLIHTIGCMCCSNRIPVTVRCSLAETSTAAGWRAAADQNPADTGLAVDYTESYLEVFLHRYTCELLIIGGRNVSTTHALTGENDCYLLHSSAVRIHQRTCHSPAHHTKTVDTSIPRDLRRTWLNTCRNSSAKAKPTYIQKRNYYSVWGKNIHNKCAATKWRAQTTFPRLLTSTLCTKKHPGGTLRSFLNTPLQFSLKSEISAHQRGQYGHRHTRR